VKNGAFSNLQHYPYGFALDQFFAWYGAEPRGPFSKAVVNEYRAQLEGRSLSASTINVHLAAVRKLAVEAADNGLLAPELAAGMLNAPDRSTRIGCRDRAILALLIGCGLRRTELISLDVESIQLRDSRWVLPDLVGKGNRLRTVPVPA
jgi:integrase/recombinase XerD